MLVVNSFFFERSLILNKEKNFHMGMFVYFHRKLFYTGLL